MFLALSLYLCIFDCPGILCLQAARILERAETIPALIWNREDLLQALAAQYVDMQGTGWCAFLEGLAKVGLARVSRLHQTPQPPTDLRLVFTKAPLPSGSSATLFSSVR